jgi:hypothetical protein
VAFRPRRRTPADGGAAHRPTNAPP